MRKVPEVPEDSTLFSRYKQLDGADKRNVGH